MRKFIKLLTGSLVFAAVGFQSAYAVPAGWSHASGVFLTPASTVPEPGTLMLFGAGLAALGAWNGLRRNSRKLSTQEARHA